MSQAPGNASVRRQDNGHLADNKVLALDRVRLQAPPVLLPRLLVPLSWVAACSSLRSSERFRFSSKTDYAFHGIIAGDLASALLPLLDAPAALNSFAHLGED
jgi:hypothetical protein